MRNYLKEIIYALADLRVDFIIGGGVAAVLHGVERITLDLDIALNMEPNNVQKFLGIMSEFAMEPRAPVPAHSLMEPKKVQEMIEEKNAFVFTFIDPQIPFKHVDVFLRKELSFPALMRSSVTVESEGRRLRVVSAEKLIALKEQIDPPRPKDQLDIAELRAILCRNGEAR